MKRFVWYCKPRPAKNHLGGQQKDVTHPTMSFKSSGGFSGFKEGGVWMDFSLG